jgi:SWI/SNF-related matrix-associated actin-dependent regulator of chromatin subfamily A-like protein 1
MFYTPLPHQVEDSERMLDYQHALLWADPGTGKTLTSMEAFRKGGYERLVVIAPRIALTMWYEELRKHLGMEYVKVLRTSSWKGFDFYNAQAIITTYDIAPKLNDLLDMYALGQKNMSDRGPDVKRPNSVMILDEAHFVKNREAKRTSGILGPGCGKLGGVAEWYVDLWMLTGTPVMRHVDDLWSQLRPTRPDILKHYNVLTYQQFVNEFCVVERRRFSPRGPMHNVVVGSKNHALLSQLLDDCKVIRRKLKDVVDNMPPVMHRTVEISYKNVENIVITDFEKFMRDLNDPDSQVSKMRRLLGLAKVSDVVSYLDETVSGMRPTLVGYWHTDVGMAYMEALTSLGHRCAMIKGGMDSRTVDKVKDDFNGGKLDYLIGQVSAMGVSYNLQELCNHVFFAEELPSPGMVDQFIARVSRRGQNKHVTVEYGRSQHSIDMALVRLRDSKQDTIDKIVT